MFSLYRTPWLDGRNLKLLGYSLSTGPNDIRTDVEIHYAALRDGEMTDLRRIFGALALPMHGKGGFIAEKIRIPENSFFDRLLRDAVAMQGALKDDELFTVQPSDCTTAWHEIHVLAPIVERLVIPYAKQKAVGSEAEVKSITQHPGFVRIDRRDPPAAPMVPATPRVRGMNAPAPTRLTHE